MSALSVQNLTVRSGSQIRLHNLSFEVPKGSRVAIIGPNGAGKSTTLQALLQLIPASFDAITYLGQPLTQLSRKSLARLVTYVPQTQPSLSITVWDWCVLARFPYQKLGFFLTQEEHDMINHTLEMTRLMQYRDTLLSHLSGGERQRALIAGALCQETPMIFLDEPTNFLDPKQAHDLLTLIYNVSNDMDKTIISVTHDINEVVHYFTHCLAIKSSEKVFYGTTKDVIHSDNLFKLYDYRFTEAQTEKGVIFW